MDKIEGGGSFSVSPDTGEVTANHLADVPSAANDPAPAAPQQSAKVTPISAAKE